MFARKTGGVHNRVEGGEWYVGSGVQNRGREGRDSNGT